MFTLPTAGEASDCYIKYGTRSRIRVSTSNRHAANLSTECGNGTIPQ